MGPARQWFFVAGLMVHMVQVVLHAPVAPFSGRGREDALPLPDVADVPAWEGLPLVVPRGAGRIPPAHKPRVWWVRIRRAPFGALVCADRRRTRDAAMASIWPGPFVSSVTAEAGPQAREPEPLLLCPSVRRPSACATGRRSLPRPCGPQRGVSTLPAA